MTTLNMPRRASGLGARLPAVAPEDARALRAVFARRLEWSAQGITLVLRTAGSTPREAALIDTPHGSARLSVASSDWRDEAGDRPWTGYEAESRLLAWTLSHETLLGKLGAVLGCDLAASALATDIKASRLAFEWRLSEGVQQARGWLQADAGLLLQHWLPLANAIAAPVPEAWHALPTQIDIRFSTRDFPPSELLATEPGDVLVIGPRLRAWSELILDQGAHRWLAAWERSALRVLGPLDPFPHLKEPPMSIDPPTQEAPATDGTGTAEPQAGLEALPVQLTFVLGQLSLSLGELASLAPGYVFDLPNRLDQAQVLLQANGRTVGRGELVVVGDTLGVQVVEIRLDGLQQL